MHLGVNPGGRTGAAGLLVDPSLPDGQAAILLHHLVVYPLVDALSVKQENGLDVPPFGHWWAVNIHTYIHTWVGAAPPELATLVWRMIHYGYNSYRLSTILFSFYYHIKQPLALELS